MRRLIVACAVLSLASCGTLRQRRTMQAEQVEVVSNGRMAAEMERIADAATIEKVVELYVESRDSTDRPRSLKVVRKERTTENRHSRAQKVAEATADSSRVVQETKAEKQQKRKSGTGRIWIVLGIVTCLSVLIGYKLRKWKTQLK